MIRTFFICLALAFILQSGEVTAARKLFTVVATMNTTAIPNCNDPDVISCQMVDVDFEAFRKYRNLEFPGGKVLTRGKKVATENSKGTYSVGYTSSTSQEFALLTYSKSKNTKAAMAGRINYPGNLVRTLQNCGDGCHIYIVSQIHEEDDTVQTAQGAQALGQEDGEDVPLTNVTYNTYDKETNTRVATKTVSLTLYYTPAYESAVGNAVIMLQQQMAELNEVFDDSFLNVRFVAHCIKRIDIGESSSANQRMTDVMNNKGTWTNVLNSADMAAVFMRTTAQGVCGMATSIDALGSYALPLVWMGNRCSPYVFAHELGHLFGARHNIEQDSTTGFNHGWLMRGSSYLTVMAYFQSGYTTRINRFSDDTRTYNGIPLGNSGANNHQQIMNTCTKYANLGDQSSQTCSTTGTGPCRDLFTNCAGWARSGYCNYYLGRSTGNFFPRQVYFSCPKSCNKCSSGGPPPCTDRWSSNTCRWIRAVGWCRYSWGKTYCKSTCNDC